MEHKLDLTIFTIPQAFKGDYGIMQKNAIQSWKLLGVETIMLFGDRAGVAKFCRRSGCINKQFHLHEKYGIPRVDTTIRDAQKGATTSLMAFINTDMMFGPEFARAIDIVSAEFERFLLIGQRTDVDFARPVDFSDEAWWEKLREFARKNGQLHGKCGLDFFVFPRNKVYHGCTDRRLSPETADGRIPPLMIGQKTWDNALMWIAALQGIPTIDVTAAVLAFHPHTQARRIKKGPTYDYNRRMGGHAGTHGRTNLATWELTEDWELHKRQEFSR